jgi:C-terminal processing protease CtpA/Prc
MHQDIRTAIVALLSAAVGALAVLLFAGNPATPESVTAGDDPGVDELRERIALLEQQISATSTEAVAAQSASAAPPEAAAPPAVAAPEQTSRAQQFDDRQRRRNDRISTRLRDAGWSDAEIDSLGALREQAALQTEQLQYESMREALAENPEMASMWRGRRSTMRDALGDEKYEDYLAAVGRPTAVEVRNVLAGSAGETAGLQPGDRIRSYGGERVYDDGDLMFALLDGDPGEAVTVEVERDGTIFHVSIPRGPLGTGRSGGFGLD